MCLSIPGKVVKITDHEKMLGLIEIKGVTQEVNLACIVDRDQKVEAVLGEWVLVHIGMAKSKIDEDEATRTLELLEQLGNIQEDYEALLTSEAVAQTKSDNLS